MLPSAGHRTSIIPNISAKLAQMNMDNNEQCHHLLKLPPEIRLHLYRTIFGVGRPIPFAVNVEGYIARLRLDTDIHFPLQFLRTCRQIYHEATPVLYGYNSFCVKGTGIGRLLGLKQFSRLCIEKVRITHNDEKLELGALGESLPGAQEVDVDCKRPLGFLLTISAISKALPCSTIRDWPRLEVHITVDSSQVPSPTSNESSDRLRQALAHHPFRLASLTSESAVKGLGLGHEMPNFSVIRVHGTVSAEHAKGIEKHKCSFGDCGFEFIGEDVGDTKDSPKIQRYRWVQAGTLDDATALKRKNSKGTAATLMTQWVPSLEPEWYQKVLDAGLLPSKEPATGQADGEQSTR